MFLRMKDHKQQQRAREREDKKRLINIAVIDGVRLPLHFPLESVTLSSCSSHPCCPHQALAGVPSADLIPDLWSLTPHTWATPLHTLSKL